MALYLAVAALGGLLWAIVIILDRLALLNLFRHPLQALIITAVLGTWGFGMLPFVETSWPGQWAATIAFVAGVLLWLSYAFYYYAMEITDEITEVAIWDAAHPLFIALFGVPLGLHLSGSSWLGILLVCGSIVAFQWHRGLPLQLPLPLWKYRSLLAANSLLMAGTYLLMGIAVGQSDYWSVYPYYLAGISSGMLVLFYRPVARAFRDTWRDLLPFWWLFLLMEIINVLAPLSVTYAMQGVHPAVAAALGATFPIYVTLAGPILRRFGATEIAFPKIEAIWVRITTLGTLALGVALLYSLTT